MPIKVSERSKIAIRLKMDGLTYREIGEKLGVSHQRAAQMVSPNSSIKWELRIRAGFKCEKCGNPDRNGHSHHKSYESIAYEDFNLLSNLEYLCPSCHRMEHGNASESMRKRFISVYPLVSDKYPAFRLIAPRRFMLGRCSVSVRKLQRVTSHRNRNRIIIRVPNSVPDGDYLICCDENTGLVLPPHIVRARPNTMFTEERKWAPPRNRFDGWQSFINAWHLVGEY